MVNLCKEWYSITKIRSIYKLKTHKQQDMVEFRTEYYTPMDRAYHEPTQLETIRPAANIEEPILPIAQLGQTVPEHDPTGRFKNIVQNVQAAIRAGTGNLQLVFQTPIEQAIGGRPKAYGEEVRRAIKEVAMANEVAITGMEMPTSLTNLSGLDMQRGIVDEEKRQRDLDEVKEMIRFAAETAQGGGVDIVSWEYDRPVHRAKWVIEDPSLQKAFARAIKEEKTKEQLFFVDKRSGQIGSIPIREGLPMFIDKKTYKDIDPIKGQPQLWSYEELEKYAKTKGLNVHTFIKERFLSEQERMAKAQEAYYYHQYESTMKQLENWDIIWQQMPEELKRQWASKEEAKKFHEKIAQSYIAGLEEQKRMQMQARQRIESWMPMEEYVLEKSKQSYAEAGIAAMQIQDKQGPKNIKKDLYVGPEIGWPQYYGSHPQEFVDLILGAREIMKKQLIAQGYSPARAAEEAKKHIKGTFDTSHMGMWLQTFHPELPWDKRKREFDKWYKEQIEWLASQNKKHDIIGAIQAVDSAGAAHGHLPPGQGILPVKEAVEILKKKGGFNGYVVSEGHEEEKFGEGRILLKTWQHFNTPFTTGYVPGMPVRRWGEVQNAYFGRTYSPMFMFGAYAPSNEFKLWSEVPLE